MNKHSSFLKNLNSTKIILLSALFFIIVGNQAFFKNVISVYPPSQNDGPFLLSLALVFFGANVLLLSLLCFRYTLKPILIFLLIASAFSSYFMDSYNIVIDKSMIQNVLQTDIHESLDLFSIKLVLYVLLLGVLPSVLLYRTHIHYQPFRQELLSRLKLVGTTLSIMVLLIMIFSNAYASFIREHKQLRYYANPSYYLYSIGKVINSHSNLKNVVAAPLDVNAHIPDSDAEKELIILVVGETARADHFSLNGYHRETNPELNKEKVYSYRNFWSCGTSTAVSVPCMFSHYDESEFDVDKEATTENVLDVLKHADTNVLWLDNNSDSKGVAKRLEYVSYKSPDQNPLCDEECRDEGMLSKAQHYIQKHPEGDILIVLHQMGNHGPAYYKRYPSEFEKFTPVCKTNQLSECSDEEIRNAYDNAILYTDHFLAKVIELLKPYDGNGYETAMLYLSDHGESLGENNLYLHGLPNLLAPDEQRHIPAILWVGEYFDEIDTQHLASRLDQRYSHDQLFHTLLGLLEVESDLYQVENDFIKGP